MATGYDMLNRSMGGRLPEQLGEWRVEGLSLKDMAERLSSDGVKVGAETLRRWCQRAGVPTHRIPAPMPVSSSSAGRVDGAASTTPLDASLAEDPAGGETAVAS
jgi:hypothetical protein